ncbi:MAG: HK97 family phage prohead protease, partial [Dehalococcoidia bacterium]
MTTASRIFTFTVINGEIDGNQNQADLDGWDFTRYNANPVVFFNHRSHDPPIGKTLSLTRQLDSFTATIELAPTLLGEQIAEMLAGGFIRGASAGWKPVEWEFLRDKTGFPKGIRSIRQELLELSVVGLPAAPKTLKQAIAADPMTSLLTASMFAEQFDDLETIVGTIPRPDNSPHQTLTPYTREDDLKAMIESQSMRMAPLAEPDQSTI